MALIPQDPLRPIDQVRSYVDRWFQELPAAFGFGPDYGIARIDVFQTDNEVVAHCDIPGLENKEDVHIRIDDTQLTIQGIVKRHGDIQEADMHRSERFVGRFQRSVSLPVRVKAEGASASYRNGVLEVRMPKETVDAARRIDVDFH
ncbi:Hsp20/alpha crystallin family protein [Paenibacillus chartarius]|uniref:Hsp20/alpha crystallin family protein n=1 Tax=Paenibacillus chartarius TaxID=747481 RepID=A0ABV6DNR6_9BACL